MKLPKGKIGEGKRGIALYLLLVPLCVAFGVLFIYGPHTVGGWVIDRVTAVLRHVGIEWFREGNREIGIIAAVVSLIVIYKIFRSARK